MSSASDFEIRELDKSLAEDGEDIILRRVIGTGNSTVNLDVRCRAFVRPVKADDSVGTMSAIDSKVIMSPTQINAAQWPGGQPPTLPAPYNPDPRVPRTNDKVIIQGRPRSISFPKPILVDGELVRIELIVSGQG